MTDSNFLVGEKRLSEMETIEYWFSRAIDVTKERRVSSIHTPGRFHCSHHCQANHLHNKQVRTINYHFNYWLILQLLMHSHQDVAVNHLQALCKNYTKETTWCCCRFNWNSTDEWSRLSSYLYTPAPSRRYLQSLLERRICNTLWDWPRPTLDMHTTNSILGRCVRFFTVKRMNWPSSTQSLFYGVSIYSTTPVSSLFVVDVILA